jgi:PAS domain-containing protein
MDTLHFLALEAWSDSSNEGLLIFDADGVIQLINPRLIELLKLPFVPRTVDALGRQVGRVLPEFRALLAAAANAHQIEWGNLRLQQNPTQRVVWQMVPLQDDDGAFLGSLIIFRDDLARFSHPAQHDPGLCRAVV